MRNPHPRRPLLAAALTLALALTTSPAFASLPDVAAPTSPPLTAPEEAGAAEPVVGEPVVGEPATLEPVAAPNAQPVATSTEVIPVDTSAGATVPTAPGYSAAGGGAQSGQEGQSSAGGGAQSGQEDQSAAGGTSNTPREAVVVSSVVPALAVVGVTWAEFNAPEGLTVRVRSNTSGQWSAWEAVEITRDAPESGPLPNAQRGGTEGVVVGGASEIAVELSAPKGTLPTHAQLHVVDPGTSPADHQPIPTTQITGGGGFTVPAVIPNRGEPEILARSAWGADETMRTWPPRVGEVTGVVVHHTAGRNGYTADEVPAIIRGIYSYHAITRGWGDIGYNFVVDRFGRIWEGRYGGITNPVVGAHAAPVNKTFFGLSLLGDYTNEAPPEVALHAIAQLVAWKFAVHGISMEGFATGSAGEALNRIVGHRDVANTACPGKDFYPLLDTLRTLVAELQPSMPVFPVSPVPYVRLAGPDRYGTAVSLSRWVHDGLTEVAYIATGATYADALAASSAAGRAHVPILLVGQNMIPDDVKVELRRLRPRSIVVLGGAAAVSDAVVAQLAAFAVPEVVAGDVAGADAGLGAPGVGAPADLVGEAAGTVAGDPDSQPGAPEDSAGVIAPGEVLPGDLAPALEPVRRIAGANRYETAALVAADSWPSGARTVYLASGEVFADALSAGAVAAFHDAPLLLTRGKSLPDHTASQLARLTPARVVLVGGTAAVAEDVAAAVTELLPKAELVRVGGSDRFATSALLVQDTWPEGAEAVFLATGANWPDALGAGPSAARFASPVLLMRGHCVPAVIRDVQAGLNPLVYYLVGGDKAIGSGAVGNTC